MYDGTMMEYLKRYHTGEINAVSSKELALTFEMPRREVCHMIKTLRREAAAPIGSCRKGYFYAAAKGELENTVFRMRRQITGIKKTVGGLNAAIYGSYESHRHANWERSER